MCQRAFDGRKRINPSTIIIKEEQPMSMMCSMQGCTQKHGMCGHEKMMIVMMVMAVVGGAAYWLLG
jgi:hypothetical protein